MHFDAQIMQNKNTSHPLGTLDPSVAMGDKLLVDHRKFGAQGRPTFGAEYVWHVFRQTECSGNSSFFAEQLSGASIVRSKALAHEEAPVRPQGRCTCREFSKGLRS